MRLFLRLFAGCLVQLAPFALLCGAPFRAHMRFSLRKTALCTALLLGALAGVFAGASLLIDRAMPDEPTQMMAVNGVFFLCLLPCVGWYFYAVRVSWPQKLFIFVFALTAALAVTSLQNAFWADDVTRYMPYEHPTLLSLTLITALLVPLLLALLRACYVPMADGLSAKEAGGLDLVALVLFVLLAGGIVPLGYEQLQNATVRSLFLILFASVFVIYAVVFRVLFHAHQHFTAQQALSRSEHQLEINREQYRRITENIAYAKRLRHDIRHHILALQTLLESGKTADAQAYLARYREGLDAHSLPTLCDNVIVGSLAGYYAEQARGQDIRFAAHVSVPAQTAVDDGDMAVLLGNLLDNALRAASMAEAANREVTLNIIFSGAMLAITVDNGYGEALLHKDGRYLSTKPNHTGLGMSSVEAIVHKYDGGFDFSHDARLFHASVMLNMGPRPSPARAE